MLTCVVTLMSIMVGAYAFHDADNVRYDCWSLGAREGDATIDCSGLGMVWPGEPPDEVEVGVKFNVSYQAIATSTDFFKSDSLIFPNRSEDAIRTLCENTDCPDITAADRDNCCVWHANVHTCHPSVISDGTVCGPWVANDGLLATHTDAQVGRVDSNFFAQDVRIDVEGVNFIIAHLRVGDIQIAIGKAINVVPRSALPTTNELLSGAAIGGITAGGLTLVFLVVIVALVIILRRRYTTKKMKQARAFLSARSLLESAKGEEEPGNEYFQRLRQMSVQSSYSVKVSKSLIINSCNLELGKTVGQGEFGIVYRGLLKRGFKAGFSEVVAVKTLKGFLNEGLVDDLLKECTKMQHFSHPNIVPVIGVCLDGGPAPYIIMPFMNNGSLLSHLKANRDSLFIDPTCPDPDDVDGIEKKLLDMCIQVAKGMEYLASKRVIHRDLAARNCMIDSNFVIKVADFGLSESMDTKEYFRQDQNDTMKLPIKWLALESISDGVFSEKTDVWAFGVTCWEVFSGGRTPYPGVHALDLASQLELGIRMDKPANVACKEEIFSIMTSCWDRKPEFRPKFSELVIQLGASLGTIGDYFTFNSGAETVPEKDTILW